MLEFFKEQLAKTKQELKDLYKQRRNAGVEAKGGYENRIAMLKKEMASLQQEIAELRTQKATNPTNDNAMSESEKQDMKKLIHAGQTAEAVDKIVEYSNDRKLLLAIANFRHHHEKYALGQLSYSNFTVEANKMNDFLISFLV
ncbi:MAG: hypothetical protein ACPG5B_16770 [Chitinophagales bacterium]